MFRIHFAATRALRALLCIAILCVISSAGCGTGDALPLPGDGSEDPGILPSEIEEPVEDGTSDDSTGSDDPVVVQPPDPSGQNEPPSADAGADQTVMEGERVTLDGSASTSGAGGALTFDWFQTAGTPVVLSSTSASVTTFTAPSDTVAAQLVFELTVFEGGLADMDEVGVNVAAMVITPPPAPGPGPQPSIDNCPNDPNKTQPGVCGCGVPDTDSDGDGSPNCVDSCPNDANKILPGQCGCGVADTDSDGDAVANCVDGCPLDPSTSDPADCAPTVGGGAQTDWDLVMLRLVNRARQDPAGEAARLGSSVVDSRAPVPPLAYDRATGQCATNHNTWMHLNLGNIASGRTPDSFTHYETVDGNSTGAPATSTPGYTGATLGTRMTTAGMNWGSVGENILTAYSSNTIAVDEAKMLTNHRGWWESSGHRNNMLSTSYTSFGHMVESQSFTPPRGGLNSPVDNILFATQNFARPLSNPRNYVFGVLYEDVDSNNGWTPKQVGDATREGLAGVAFTVQVAGTATVVASDTTMDNGAFSATVADGTYDVRFAGSSLPGGVLNVTGVVVSGANVDIGDWDAGP